MAQLHLPYAPVGWNWLSENFDWPAGVLTGREAVEDRGAVSLVAVLRAPWIETCSERWSRESRVESSQFRQSMCFLAQIRMTN